MKESGPRGLWLLSGGHAGHPGLQFRGQRDEDRQADRGQWGWQHDRSAHAPAGTPAWHIAGGNHRLEPRVQGCAGWAQGGPGGSLSVCQGSQPGGWDVCTSGWLSRQEPLQKPARLLFTPLGSEKLFVYVLLRRNPR